MLDLFYYLLRMDLLWFLSIPSINIIPVRAASCVQSPAAVPSWVAALWCAQVSTQSSEYLPSWVWGGKFQYK